MLADGRVGRITGARENSYTLGVVCAKVARYSERIDHPERLLHPLRRAGPKGSGRFAQISWDAALLEIAERFTRIAQRSGAEGDLAVSLRRQYGGFAALWSRPPAQSDALLAAANDDLRHAGGVGDGWQGLASWWGPTRVRWSMPI